PIELVHLNVSASHTPIHPCDRKPPGPLVRVCSPTAGNGPMPTTSARPVVMNATLATPLMIANQYSNSPKRPTFAVFIPPRPADTAATHSHRGASGNQKPK